MQYECDNAFPNLSCVPEPFFLEEKQLELMDPTATSRYSYRSVL